MQIVAKSPINSFQNQVLRYPFPQVFILCIFLISLYLFLNSLTYNYYFYEILYPVYNFIKSKNCQVIDSHSLFFNHTIFNFEIMGKIETHLNNIYIKFNSKWLILHINPPMFHNPFVGQGSFVK